MLGYIKVNPNKMLTSKTPKNPKNYSCECCDFKCSNKKDYNRHNLTAKHQMLTNANTNANENTQKNAKVFMCSCGKEYKQAPSLTRHKKKCTYVDNIDDDISDDDIPDEIQNSISEPTSDASIILRLLKQNQEFKELMVEERSLMIEEHSAVVALQKQNMELQSQMVDVVKMELQLITTPQITTLQITINLI